MRVKQINNIVIHLDRDSMYRCRRRAGGWGTVTLEEFCSLAGAEEFCRATLDYTKRPTFRHKTLTSYPNKVAGVTVLDESREVTGIYLRDARGGLWPARTVDRKAKHYRSVVKAWLRRAGAEDRRKK